MTALRSGEFRRKRGSGICRGRRGVNTGGRGRGAGGLCLLADREAAMTLPLQGVDMSARKEVARYWEARQDLLYYQVVRVLAQGLSKEAASILDVGSAACPCLDWFPHIEKRVSVDLYNP